MYFYCFLPFLSSDFTDFTDFSLCLEPQTTQTDAKIIYDSCRCNLLFLRISAYSVVFFINIGLNGFHGFSYLSNLCNLWGFYQQRI